MRTAIVSDKAPWPRGSHSPAIIAGAPTVYVSAQGTVARPHQLRQRAVAAFPTRVIRQLLEQRSPFGQPPQHHRRRELRQHDQRETSRRGVAARGGVGGRTMSTARSTPSRVGTSRLRSMTGLLDMPIRPVAWHGPH